MADVPPIVRNGPTIAVFRALQLGDLVCALPALRALRATHSGAHLALIGLPWARQLQPRLSELVDEVIEFPGYPGLEEQPVELGAVASFLAAMRERRFDLSVQLHGSGPVSNVVVAQLGARDSIGTYRLGDWQPGPGYVRHDPRLSEVDRLLAVTRGNGMPDDDAIPHLAVTDEDRAELRRAVPEIDGGTTVVLHPGGRDPLRRWNAEGFAAVADRIADRGMRVVLTGLDEDRAIHRSVSEHATHPPRSLAGMLSLGAFMALLASARLVVTNDTATSHLAAAVDAPAVTVFVATDPQRWAPPARPRHRVVGGPPALPAGDACCVGEDCPIHRRIRPVHPPVEDVLGAVNELLMGEWSRAA